MKIYNVRLGFATNSSSCHSIVFTSVPVKDQYPDCEGGDGFGWNKFILSSREAKFLYLASQIYHNLLFYGVQDQVNAYINESLFPKELCQKLRENIPDIDHNSMMRLPRTVSHQLNAEFLTDLVDHISSDDLVIFGGNDNDFDDDSFYQFIDQVTCRVSPANQLKSLLFDFTARYDQKNRVWVFLNIATGARITFSFDGNAVPFDQYVPSFPLLADIKITDYCGVGCPFCYQNSSLDGKHASFDVIRSVLFDLRRLGVMEVALGGGDPITHPDIQEIILVCKELDVVANFSTGSLDWANDSKLFNFVLDYTGRVGFSTTSVDRLLDLMELYKKNRRFSVRNKVPLETFGKKFAVHLIPAILSQDVFRQFVDVCSDNRIPVVLLDFKQTGRGALMGCDPRSAEYVFDILSRIDGLRFPVSIDTPFAARFQDRLSDVPKILYSTKEGETSFYIDCVKCGLKESSYSEGSLSEFSTDNFLNVVSDRFPQWSDRVKFISSV